MTEGLITVRDGSSIFHRDVGSGPAVVMVPAWSMTADAFSHQVGHLGQNYRVIALDPRGQGRSSTTLEGNDYVTHAHDLHDVVQHLGLTRFALVGWSNGALAAAHYVDIYGVDLLWALVDIDMPALAVPKAPGDWAEVPCLDAFQGFLGPLTVDPEAFRRQMVRFFVERDLSDEEERWLLAQMHSQPPSWVACCCPTFFSTTSPRCFRASASRLPRSWQSSRHGHGMPRTGYVERVPMRNLRRSTVDTCSSGKIPSRSTPC